MSPELTEAFAQLDWLEGYMGHQVFEDGSDGFDHFIPIRNALNLLLVYEPIVAGVRDAPGAAEVVATMRRLAR